MKKIIVAFILIGYSLTNNPLFFKIFSANILLLLGVIIFNPDASTAMVFPN